MAGIYWSNPLITHGNDMPYAIWIDPMYKICCLKSHLVQTGD